MSGFLSDILQTEIESKIPKSIWINLDIPITNIIEIANSLLNECDDDDEHGFLLRLLELLKRQIENK